MYKLTALLFDSVEALPEDVATLAIFQVISLAIVRLLALLHPCVVEVEVEGVVGMEASEAVIPETLVLQPATNVAWRIIMLVIV